MKHQTHPWCSRQGRILEAVRRCDENKSTRSLAEFFPIWHCLLSLGCSVHHLACTVQARGCIGMRQVFTFAPVGYWNIMQVGMLHLIPTVRNSSWLSCDRKEQEKSPGFITCWLWRYVYCAPGYYTAQPGGVIGHQIRTGSRRGIRPWTFNSLKNQHEYY